MSSTYSAAPLIPSSGEWATTLHFPAESDPLESAIYRGKLQILGDVRRGKVPVAVSSFSELHDYVDANYYGDGFDWPILPSELDDHKYQDAFANFWNTVQHQLDAWIRSGQMRSALETAANDGN